MRVRRWSAAGSPLTALKSTPSASSRSVAVNRWPLYANYTDGILTIHRGRVVYERYFGCLDEEGQHAAMSMTKSITGLLAEILVVEGVLDDTLTVAEIIPEIAK